MVEYRGGISGGGGVRERGGEFGHGSGVGDGGGYFGDHGLLHEGFPVHDGVETVVGVGGVLYGTSETVWVHQGVAALDDVSVAGLVLVLAVPGEAVLDVIGVAVLRVWVVFLGDDGFGDGGGVGYGSGDFGVGGGVGQGSGWDDAGLGYCDYGSKS